MRKQQLGNQARPKLKTILHKRRAYADAELDIPAFIQATIEEAIQLYPKAVSLEASPWPVITKTVIVASVRLEVEV